MLNATLVPNSDSAMASENVRNKKAGCLVQINSENCKACGLCIANCPKKVLARGSHLNSMGYEATVVVSDRCVGCGICFYSCPEPDAIALRPPFV